MAIILKLNPAIEAQLIHQAAQQGVPVSRYIETLLENPTPAHVPPPQEQQYDQKSPESAYLARVHQVLKQLDQLPRLSPPPAPSPDDILGFDEWGLPTK